MVDGNSILPPVLLPSGPPTAFLPCVTMAGLALLSLAPGSMPALTPPLAIRPPRRAANWSMLGGTRLHADGKSLSRTCLRIHVSAPTPLRPSIYPTIPFPPPLPPSMRPFNCVVAPFVAVPAFRRCARICVQSSLTVCPLLCAVLGSAVLAHTPKAAEHGARGLLPPGNGYGECEAEATNTGADSGWREGGGCVPSEAAGHAQLTTRATFFPVRRFRY